MKTENIPLSLIQPNDGQIPGLPRNPRSWSVRELSRLKKSIQETPEMLELRPPLVYAYDGQYIVIGGNMRTYCIKEMGTIQEAPCIVIPPNTPLRKLKEIAIKDNSKFGDWDYDALADEWSEFDLSDYGINDYGTTGEDAAPDGNAAPIDDRVTIEIEFTPDEFLFVTGKLRILAPNAEDAVIKALGL